MAAGGGCAGGPGRWRRPCGPLYSLFYSLEMLRNDWLFEGCVCDSLDDFSGSRFRLDYLWWGLFRNGNKV